MKVVGKNLELFENVLQTCSTVGIEKLIINKKQIRGIDEKSSIVIFTDQNKPDLGKQIGLNRLDLLISRLNLVKLASSYEIEAVEAKNGTDISHLQLSGGSTKVDFRCASVEHVKGVPTAINNIQQWMVEIPTTTIQLLTQAVSAMGAESLTLTSKQTGELYFECVDTNNDMFSDKLTTKATWIPETDEPKSKAFCFSYQAKIALTLLKAASSGLESCHVTVGDRGILAIIVKGLDFYNLPLIT